MQSAAELSTLSNRKRTFDQTAQQALDMRSAVDSGVDSAVWTGAYSYQFRSAWQEYRRNPETLHQALVQGLGRRTQGPQQHRRGDRRERHDLTSPAKTAEAAARVDGPAAS